MELSLWKLSAAFTSISSILRVNSPKILTKDLVETRNVLHIPLLDFLRHGVENPKSLSIVLDASDVGVRSEQDVL